MKKLIRVTKADIEAGKAAIAANRLNPVVVKATGNFCPVAQALHRQGLKGAYVGWCYWYLPEQTGTNKLPLSAIKWITRFDKRKPVKPFNFYINY